MVNLKEKEDESMSEYMDETSLTDEEIAEAIAAAKKAKAAKRAKAAEGKKTAEPKASDEPSDDAAVKINKSETGGEESSKELFDEIDQTVDDEEKLSPKMRSAKSFSNAFAAAKIKREEELKRKKAAKEAAEAAEAEGEDPDEEPEQDAAIDDEAEAEIAEAFESEDSEDIEDADFEIDDEAYEEADLDSEDYDGVFEADEEGSDEYAAAVEISENENDFADENEDRDDDDDDDDEDDEDDDDDEGAFSTKTKIIIGVIIVLLIAAIVAAGAYFFSHRDNGKTNDVTSSAVDDTVKSIKFKEPSMSLRVGESKSLEIIIEPEGAADKVFKLKSNDPAIAKVDEKGVVTGVASGNTTITATLKNNETITASLIVNVIDEKQNAINVYNKFVNSIIDGTTDIESDEDTDTDESQGEEEETDSDTEEDTDSALKVRAPKHELSGSIIKDLDSDGELELAIYYKGKDTDSDNVRIFYLGVEGEEEDEPEYDEWGNPIENEEGTDSEKKDTSTDEAPKDKILKEIDEYAKPERFGTCYAALDGAHWNTCLIEVKEDETAQAKVTILSEDYTAPTYVYECEDTTIATVDAQGNIKGVKPGTTFVTVTSQLNPDAVAKIKVRVKDDTDLLEDYLAQVPTVNNTNDNVIPTETLTAKAITDLDGDGVSELLLRFNYGHNVETINIVKVENEQCIVYKTYNNISDLYEFYEGDGSYKNQVLIHYTTGKVCLQYSGTVFKENSKTKTTEQRIYSLEDNGNLSELVNFATTTDISTKTMTSEVESTVSESEEDTDSTVENDDTSSETLYEPEDGQGDNDQYDDGEDDEEGYQLSYAAVDIDALASGRGGLTFVNKTKYKNLPARTGAPDDEDNNDEDEDDYYEEDDNTSSDEDTDEDSDDGDSSRRTVTTEVQEESTKYFVNGTPVEKSVYDEYLSTYSSRYSVWNGWEPV